MSDKSIQIYSTTLKTSKKYDDEEEEEMRDILIYASQKTGIVVGLSTVTLYVIECR